LLRYRATSAKRGHRRLSARESGDGVRRRYCGKAFSYAPALIQHEKSHCGAEAGEGATEEGGDDATSAPPRGCAPLPPRPPQACAGARP